MKVEKVILDSSYVEESDDGDGGDEDDQIDPNGEEGDAEENGRQFSIMIWMFKRIRNHIRCSETFGASF